MGYVPYVLLDLPSADSIQGRQQHWLVQALPVRH
jgi:hypothetical protein